CVSQKLNMNRSILIFTALITLAAVNTSYSQATQEWVQTYNGTGDGLDISFSVVTDPLGNVYVAGNSPGDASANDITTIKYNSAGQQQWVQRYNGPGNTDDGTTERTPSRWTIPVMFTLPAGAQARKIQITLSLSTIATATSNGLRGTTDPGTITMLPMASRSMAPATFM